MDTVVGLNLEAADKIALAITEAHVSNATTKIEGHVWNRGEDLAELFLTIRNALMAGETARMKTRAAANP